MSDTNKIQCLICEKPVTEEQYLLGAGYAYLEFHYGSRHDQLKGFDTSQCRTPDDTRLNKLVYADVIEAYICDDCFERKQHLCRGFKVKKQETRTEIT